MKKLNYSPAADHHPGWLRFIFIVVFVGTLFLVCAFTFNYFDNHAAFLGIPVGFFAGYYIAYYGLYGLYQKFSDTSRDTVYDELEKKDQERKKLEEGRRLQELSKKIQENEDKK